MPYTSPAVLRPRAADTPAMQRRQIADATVPPAARSPVPTLFPQLLYLVLYSRLALDFDFASGCPH